MQDVTFLDKNDAPLLAAAHLPQVFEIVAQNCIMYALPDIDLVNHAPCSPSPHMHHCFDCLQQETQS
jgi:hypothetical protein